MEKEIKGNLTSHQIVLAFEELVDLMVEGGAPETTSERLAEIDEDAVALFEKLGEEVPEKLDRLRAVETRLAAEANLLVREAKRLKGRANSIEIGVDRVRQYAADILKARRRAGQDPKVKTSEGTYWLQKSTRFESPSQTSAWLEQGFVKTQKVIDRDAARKAIKEGVKADGFGFVESESIRWR